MFLEYFGRKFYVDNKAEIALTAVIYLFSDNLSHFVQNLKHYHIDYTME